MPKSLKIRVQDRPGDPLRVVEATFEDDEWAAVQKFVEVADRLSENGIVRGTQPIKAGFHWKEGGALVPDVVLPPEESQESLLMRLRMVILQKERTHFGRVVGVLGRRVADPSFREGLDVIRAQFAGRDVRSVVQVTVSSPSESLDITSDEALDVWLNGHIYHGDPDKQELLRRVHGVLTFEYSRAILLMLLVAKAHAAINLAKVIRVLDGRQKEVGFSSQAPAAPAE